MPQLSEAETSARLKTLPGWTYGNNAISKQFRFKNFMAAIGFINRIAPLAEAADHHPDMLINYSRVTFSCSTHSEGGVTEKDFALAAQIEREFAAHGS
ncbi:MAG TPA: 4a-hydroxytetrahydrobiopterin dehydratase [Candidatus Binataceae bacterium]|nr:4a-hydroxytetrahydrobiopterin dehydratase [Candidatus Binataceae bacterium]